MTKDEITDVCAIINAEHPELCRAKPNGRKRALGLFKSVQATLTYARRNRAQVELAELFNTSQSTISRTITIVTPILGQVLADYVPTADHLDPNAQLIVDGTLAPCWSWAHHPELWSGKHRTTGWNIQVACTLSGQLVWVSDALPGSTHDSKALREHGFLDTTEPLPPIGDKGYIGLGMITPAA